jgi:hypothetical protein
VNEARPAGDHRFGSIKQASPEITFRAGKDMARPLGKV